MRIKYLSNNIYDVVEKKFNIIISNSKKSIFENIIGGVIAFDGCEPTSAVILYQNKYLEFYTVKSVDESEEELLVLFSLLVNTKFPKVLILNNETYLNVINKFLDSTTKEVTLNDNVLSIEYRRGNYALSKNILIETKLFCYSLNHERTYNVSINSVIDYLSMYFPISEIEDNKEQIHSIVYSINVNYFSGIGEKHAVLIRKDINLKTNDTLGAKNFLNSMIEKGYKYVDDKPNGLVLDDRIADLMKYDKIICRGSIKHSFIWYNVFYIDALYDLSLSYIRNVMRFMKRVSCDTYVTGVYLYDELGFMRINSFSITSNVFYTIPRMYKTALKSSIKKAELKLFFDDYLSSRNLSIGIRKTLVRLSCILSKEDVLTFIHNLDEYSETISENGFRFNAMCVFQTLNSMLDNKILTKKALNIFLIDKSYIPQLTRISHINDMSHYTKDYRKYFSSYIRKGKSIEYSNDFSLRDIILNNISKDTPSDKLSNFTMKLNSFVSHVQTSKHRDENLFSLCNSFKLLAENIMKDRVYLDYVDTFIDCYYKYYDLNNNCYNISLSEQSDYPLKFLFKNYNKYSMGLIKDLFYHIFENMVCNKVNHTTIHDYSFKLEELLSMNILNEESIRKIAIKSPICKLDKVYFKLKALDCGQNVNKRIFNKVVNKKFKSNLNDAILDGSDLDILIDFAKNQINQLYLLNKKIDSNLVVPFNNFIERMKNYVNNINVADMFSVFGDKVLDIINGEIDGIFSAKDYYLNNVELGTFVSELLKSDTFIPKVKNRKRLYSSLSNIKPIDDILSGNINTKERIAILNEIKQRNISFNDSEFISDLFIGKIEPKCSPEFLIAGDASVCCMSFKTEKATEYALEKGFGVINIYYKDRIIANSVIWINNHYNNLVIDNIEVHPNYTKFKMYIERLYRNMISDIVSSYELEFAVQGRTYNDLKLYSQKQEVFRQAISARDISSRDFYTDANDVCIVDTGKHSKEYIINEYFKKSILDEVVNIVTNNTEIDEPLPFF